MSKVTPMMAQFNELKSQFPDCILFFRLGDFYEMFGEDAKICAKVLNITLTARNKSADAVAMCGVPYHAAENYVYKLTSQGYKVAICEQIKDTDGKTVLKRDVVSVVTKATNFCDQQLDHPLPNYILFALNDSHNKVQLQMIDLSTLSKIELPSVEQSEIPKICEKYMVSELVSNLTNLELHGNTYFYCFQSNNYTLEEYIKQYLNSLKLQGLYERLTNQGLKTNNQSFELSHLTLKNLEIFYNYDGTKLDTFFDFINKCKTPMGQRKLFEMVLHPLLDLKTIEKRQSFSECLTQQYALMEDLGSQLNGIRDIERLTVKILNSNATPKDLIALKQSLKQCFAILQKPIAAWPKEYYQNVQMLPIIMGKLANLQEEDVKTVINTGFIFKVEASKELEQLRELVLNSKDALVQLQQAEIKKTEIQSLKVKYNKVFGYFLEVPKSKSHLVDKQRYTIKQTLVNAERFITEELKMLEIEIISASDQMVELERQMFEELLIELAKDADNLKQVAQSIAEIDVWTNFAKLVLEEKLSFPKINTTKTLAAQEVWHPVVAKHTGDFIRNDIALAKEQTGYVITGPNMGGKSTYLRQTGLLVLMAQIGMPVAAKSAEVGICDQIFTRVGASDNLRQGQSTFMVEMLETAEILLHATEKSLILVDELGRGTSTLDGASLAKAVVKHLDQNIACRYLFATHYHEIIDLVATLQNSNNKHMQVAYDENGEPIFMRKLISGGMEDSFGFFVAKQAGLPQEVIEQAKQLKANNSAVPSPQRIQKTIFETAKLEPKLETPVIHKKLKDLELESLNPIQALNLLFEWKKEI